MHHYQLLRGLVIRSDSGQQHIPPPARTDAPSVGGYLPYSPQQSDILHTITHHHLELRQNISDINQVQFTMSNIHDIVNNITFITIHVIVLYIKMLLTTGEISLLGFRDTSNYF